MPEAARTRPRQAGYTLIEIMVVVFIIAVMAGISVLAIRQAEGRTLRSQAENLQVWLQSLADRSILEQGAYGIRVQDGRVQPFVYYQRYWYPVREPAPFQLQEPVQLILAEAETGLESASDEEDNLLPSLIFSEGNMVPEDGMVLGERNKRQVYQFIWDSESSEIKLQGEGADS